MTTFVMSRRLRLKTLFFAAKNPTATRMMISICI